MDAFTELLMKFAGNKVKGNTIKINNNPIKGAKGWKDPSEGGGTIHKEPGDVGVSGEYYNRRHYRRQHGESTIGKVKTRKNIVKGAEHTTKADIVFAKHAGLVGWGQKVLKKVVQKVKRKVLPNEVPTPPKDKPVYNPGSSRNIHIRTTKDKTPGNHGGY